MTKVALAKAYMAGSLTLYAATSLTTEESKVQVPNVLDCKGVTLMAFAGVEDGASIDAAPAYT